MDSIFQEFADLYKKENLPDCDHGIIMDGITDRNKYESQAHRILFICKEHNRLNDSYDTGDVRVWWSKLPNVRYVFSHRISEWAYGIANDFPAHEQIVHTDKEQALTQIAFINIKKTWGDANAESDVLWKYVKASKDLLQKQIAEIDPTIIITCFRYDYLTKLLFDFDTMPITPHGFSYGKWNGRLVINYFHPSARKNKQVLYDTLKEVVTYSLSN